jgi:hypothetical protein
MKLMVFGCLCPQKRIIPTRRGVFGASVHGNGTHFLEGVTNNQKSAVATRESWAIVWMTTSSQLPLFCGPAFRRQRPYSYNFTLLFVL